MANKPAKKGEGSLNFKSTADIKISDKIIGQVVGQESGVEIIKKAAEQRRHVLLIGEPGTGKSMLGLALAELLPKEKLVDILAYPNLNDENMPIIKTVAAGHGRDIVAKGRIQANAMFKNQNVILFILAIIGMIVPWWARAKYNSDIMFAAFFLGGILFLASFIIFANLGQRMNLKKAFIPKIIVDNFGKKIAPFYDATGAISGALLGDVMHDPFQCFFGSLCIKMYIDGELKKTELKTEIDSLFQKNTTKILKEKSDYEAFHLPKNELIVLGETNGSISPVEVLSSNRHEHDGEMIKLTTSGNKELIVTPEHKIAVWKNNRIVYVEALELKENDEVVASADDIIIDEQDIINTYDKRQQEQCRLYHQYLDIKNENSGWGYKRIAKTMQQKIGKTRWWHASRHTPVPIQTANWLKENGLLPLKIDNPKLPLIAKVLGATFGDGGIFENLNGVFLSSSEKEAVEEFGKDLETIFNLNKDKNSRIIEGGVYGHSWCYQNTNRGAIRFLLALGAPQGNKTNIELKIPSWISLNERLQDEFFGSFFGGELGSPSLHKNGNRLTTLEVGITGKPEFSHNRNDFLNKIAFYLSRKNISCSSIYTRKLSDDSVIHRLQIAKHMDNILNFVINIRLNYCKYKAERLYKALGDWAIQKKITYNSLIERGYGAEHAMKLIKLSPNSLYLLLNHFGEEALA